VTEFEVARRVLHWLAVGGIVLGATQVFALGVPLVTWGLRSRSGSPPIGIGTAYQIVALVAVLAPFFLVVGSAGLLRERRWALPVLTVYAYLQIAGSLAGLAAIFVFSFTNSRGSPFTVAQRAAAPLIRIEDMLLHCLYPVAILLCLVRPGLIPSESASTFEVLPAPGPARPVQPLES
jgi:hypothetical protein